MFWGARRVITTTVGVVKVRSTASTPARISKVQKVSNDNRYGYVRVLGGMKRFTITAAM